MEPKKQTACRERPESQPAHLVIPQNQIWIEVELKRCDDLQLLQREQINIKSGETSQLLDIFGSISKNNNK